MRAHRRYLAAAFLLLAPGAAAQEGGGGMQTFNEAPSISFGDDLDLGKYNYLGRLSVPGEYQIPGQGSPITLDGETLKRLYTCPKGVCAEYGGAVGNPKLDWYKAAPETVAIAPEFTAPVAVADDEVRLENPQAVELGFRLTVAGVPSTVNIEASGTFTQKLAPGATAVAEIASGSTVTTTSLQPGKAYSIQIVGSAYFIVPAN